MLRGVLSSTASRFAGGAAVAAATAPDVSHARSLQPPLVLPSMKGEDLSPVFQDLEKMRVDNGEWLLTNVRDGKIFVEPADVEEALSEVLGLSYSRSKPAVGCQAFGSDCTSDDDDASSCISWGSSANEHIERAEILPLQQCGSMLTALLNNPGVQKSVHQALQEDPNFTSFMAGVQGPLALLPSPEPQVVIQDVTDAAAEDPSSNSKASAMQTVMDKLGNGLVRLGEDVISAGGQLGGMFVGLGNNLRGTILGAQAQTKKAVQSKKKEFWMNALGVLAVAVLSILFAKGKLKVRKV